VRFGAAGAEQSRPLFCAGRLLESLSEPGGSRGTRGRLEQGRLGMTEPMGRAAILRTQTLGRLPTGSARSWGLHDDDNPSAGCPFEGVLDVMGSRRERRNASGSG
jgi:hypothetical protein